MTSAVSTERECACASLANLVFDHAAIPALLQQDIVRRLGPLLIDDNRGIQEGAAGTLRYSIPVIPSSRHTFLINCHFLGFKIENHLTFILKRGSFEFLYKKIVFCLNVEI